MKMNLIKIIPLIVILFFAIARAEDQIPKKNKANYSIENLARQVVIGTVTKVQGHPTVLSYKQKEAVRVVAGQPVLSDSSFYCPDNSFISIKLNNKLSYLKIGQLTSAFLFKDKNTYTVRLHSGFIKTLFKSDDSATQLNIMTNNSLTKIQEAKSLFIYNSLFKKTSLVNYKGKVEFSANQSKNASITLNKLEYSYLDDKMKTPSEPQLLTPKQLSQFLEASEIDPEKLD